jgi:hypothetical protein
LLGSHGQRQTRSFELGAPLGTQIALGQALRRGVDLADVLVGDE